MKKEFIKFIKRTLIGLSEMSTCYRVKVGAIIVKDNRIISTGYNGTVGGVIECNEYKEFLSNIYNGIRKDLINVNSKFARKMNNIYKKLRKKETGQNNEEVKIEKEELDLLHGLEDFLLNEIKYQFKVYLQDLNKGYLENKTLVDYTLDKLSKIEIRDIFEMKEEDFIYKYNVFHSDKGIFGEVHAEQNALMFCSKYGIETEGASIWVTHLPCIHCAKLIKQSGIKEVYYLNIYENKNLNNETTLKFFKGTGIKVEKIDNLL